jgi:hypothetical protein
MKKILITGLAIVMFVTMAVVPAQADNSEEVAIGILGGVVGGLILGEVFERPRYREPVRVYEYEEPYMVRECVTKYRRYYDSMGNYVRRPVKKCYWVERY